uniref:Uncharacterized protein n=1 Tax=Fagus sylvatica TaxID=28930 RepID=A0A2N9IZ84_FAGSY
MDVEDIKRIRDRYQVSEDVILCIPNLDERACSSKLDNVAFYKADFNANLSFPMQPFMRELLGRLNLSPGQLAPNAWRTVISCMVMWRVCSRGADAIMVDEFLYCYKPSQITVSSGFWTFNGQQKGMKLITGLLTSNREWKDGFIFVCGDNWEDPPWEERDENFVHIPISRPTLDKEGRDWVLRALHHKDHHYTNFIQPELLVFYSFGLQPNQTVLSFGMATVKVNKDKLKKMMGQKDAMTVNLGKRPSSIELIETSFVPSSSKAVEKAPTLPKDASLALRRAKSVVTKDDMDEYGKLNTNVVKRGLACSMMKGLTEAMVIANRCIQWEEGLVKLKTQLIEAKDANTTLTLVATALTQEKVQLADDLERLKSDMATKDEELARTTESYKRALDQLRTLSEQMESTKAKEKYSDLDFDVFQLYEYDESMMPVEEIGDMAASADPQLDDDATT